MLKKKLVVLSSILFGILSLNVVQAEDLEKRTFVYTQGFEEKDPVKFYMANGEYTVNFKGLTEEKVFSGKKSFKLDVTFGENCSYAYWKIPVRVPAEGQLKYSGRIFLGEESTGRKTNLGVSYHHKPLFGGCHVWLLSVCKGKWMALSQRDIVKEGKSSARRLAKRVWGCSPENLSPYLEGCTIFLRGKEGSRFVVYLDDIKIEGEDIPTEEAFRQEKAKRWAPVKERIARKISYWENTLAEISKSLSSFEGEKKKEVSEKVNSLITEVAKIKAKGYVLKKTEEKISSSIRELKNEVEVVI